MKTTSSSFHDLKGAKKIQFIWDYYKLPLLIAAVIVYALIWQIHARMTHKDTVLYMGAVNIQMGEILQEELTGSFLETQNLNDKHHEVFLNSSLVLTVSADANLSQYTYASRLKINAAIEAQEFDLVLMNREAYDAFSQNGYLYDLSVLLDADLQRALSDSLITNTVILEDNASEAALDPSLTYHAVTQDAVNALDVTASPLFSAAGMDGTVYLGIIANSPRTDMASAYVKYLFHIV